MKKMGFDHSSKINEMLLERILGSAESLFITDTYQFDDYSKYVATAFDPEAKAQRRKEVFPNDCKKAFEMGVRLTQPYAQRFGE
ncbi:hypothetical protein SPSIL_037490 [Sporomusa silvacetica DSM 10669]|uniref:Uncharacterized protein n=2 Tax=Sporomusa silvacetica TaxID=55504 RepID=A0ABZ3IPG8_9FIRM|nr:hypothetical protein SPSIL_18550 [Sporomusa silvacetica DSM 10669]